MKVFVSFCLLVSTLFAKDIYPTFILTSKGFVNDFVYDDGKLYVATDIGTVEIYDLYGQKQIDEIVLPKLFTTKLEEVPPKVLSIDRLNNQLLLVSTTLKGFRNVWLHDGQTLKKIISKEKKLTIKEARFLDNKRFMLGTLGHEIIQYNTTDNYKAYSTHVEQSTFSDMLLTPDKKHLISSSESGRVSITDINSGKVVDTLESQNVDNIYKIAYANGTIITAGQDRRVGIYPKDGKAYHIKNPFLVYVASLSPSGKTGIFSSTENHYLQLFDVESGKLQERLIGHYATPTTIKFINEKEFFSSGDEKNIFYWNLYLNN